MKRYIRTTAIGIALYAATAGIAAHACSLMPLTPEQQKVANAQRERFLLQSVQQADAIVEVEALENSKIGRRLTLRTKVKVVSLLGGNMKLGKKLTLKTPNGPCDDSYQKGRRLIIMVKGNRHMGAFLGPRDIEKLQERGLLAQSGAAKR